MACKLSISQHSDVVKDEFLIGQKKKLHCLSPRANYTDRATAACRRSDANLRG
jgi:hypothetical protein